MSLRRYDMVGLAVILLAALALAFPAPAPAHGNHPNAAKRTGHCSKPKQQSKRIARHTAGYAVKRFGLAELIVQDDRKRANRQMDNFLRWKLGGAVAVCGQYVTANYDHFERAYSDEAAAMMLGILTFGRQEPELELPNWVIAYLEFKYDMVTLGGTGAVLKRLGLPDHYINAVRGKIFDQVAKPVFDAVVSVRAYVPKSFDIDNRFVEEAIAARRYGNQGIDVLRANWGGGDAGSPAGDTGRSFPGDIRSKLPGVGGTTMPDFPDHDPGPDGATDTAEMCPGNQIRLEDGSCGCYVDEVLQGQTCVEVADAHGPTYEELPPEVPVPAAEAPGHVSDEMPLQGDTPWYER